MKVELPVTFFGMKHASKVAAYLQDLHIEKDYESLISSFKVVTSADSNLESAVCTI